MMVGFTIQAPRGHRRRNRFRPPPRYQVGSLAFMYILTLLFNLACLVLMFPLLLLVYPLSGIFLSRVIERQTKKFKYAANIDNIYASKMHFIPRWPIIMPALIWRIFVTKFF